MKDKIIDYSKKIIKNQYFLYFVFILAILNVVTYLSSNNYNAILLFIAISILLRQTTENYAVIFIISIILTNSYILIDENYKIISGFRSRNSKNDKFVNRNYRRKKNKLQPAEYPDDDSILSDDDYDDDDDVFSDESLDKNEQNNIDTYNKMTETYNNLVQSIRAKTDRIKQLSRKIKM
tara:strand:- start:5133 stop:5669 length:537 start_codon:yes stop_codon:yes gene_type:complete